MRAMLLTVALLGLIVVGGCEQTVRQMRSGGRRCRIFAKVFAGRDQRKAEGYRISAARHRTTVIDGAQTGLAEASGSWD